MGDDSGEMGDSLDKQQKEMDRKTELARAKLANERMRIVQSESGQQWTNPDKPQDDNQPTGI
jgi:hypothetical protein